MKNYEIRKIGPGSIFKLYFTIGTVIGFIVSLILLLAGATLNSIGMQLGTADLMSGGALQVAAIILGIIIGSLVYGLLTGIMGIVGAMIYNVFAALVGGIVINLTEKE